MRQKENTSTQEEIDVLTNLFEWGTHGVRLHLPAGFSSEAGRSFNHLIGKSKNENIRF